MEREVKFNDMLKDIGTSRVKAIKAMCYQCSGYSFREARLCTCRTCPLYILKVNLTKRGEEDE